MKKEKNTVKRVEELLTKIPKEHYDDFVRTASKAENVDAVKAIAQDYKINLTDEQAELLLQMYSEAIELPVDYLESVAGGTESDTYAEIPSTSTSSSGGC